MLETRLSPLKAMMDVEFPTRGPGYLDIGRTEAPMRDAATVWIAQNIQLYEEDARLPDGQWPRGARSV